MLSYAIVRPDRDHWQDPITVLVAEYVTLAEALEVAQRELAVWPSLVVEEWIDPGYCTRDAQRYRRATSRVVQTFTRQETV